MTKKFSLDALKAAFASADKKGGGGFAGDAFYPFWKMKEGTPSDTHNVAIVRFLPDANGENPFGFIQENAYHNLLVNGKKRRVPCLSMYGERCPVCAHSSKLYEEGDETNGKRYYRVKEYLANVIVRHSPFEYDGVGKAKLISFGPKIFKNIQAVFASGELDTEPFDFENGYDFRIVKTKSGEYANYDTSAFARRSSALSVEELEEAMNNEIDLSTKRTAQMPVAELEALLLADISGSAYSDGSSEPAKPSTPAPEAPSAPAPSASLSDSDPAPAAPAPAASDDAPKTKPSAAELIARLKAKNQAAG